MKNNLEIIENSEKFDSIPKFICTKCNLGVLKLIDIDKEQSSISKNRYEILGDEESIFGNFVAKLKCENSDCQEKYFTTGIYNTIKDGFESLYFPEVNDTVEVPKIHTKYQIKYINPNINIINLPEKLPEKLLYPINQSFSLYWIDKSACANKIRIVIEILLDIKKIRKTSTINGKRKRLNLHRRILEFKKKYPDIGDNLLALKFIGNKGSHTNIKNITILDAYKILENVLNLLYKKKNINHLIKKYNK